MEGRKDISHSRVSIAAASFSIDALEALKKELEKIEELRFIFTPPTFVKEKSILRFLFHRRCPENQYLRNIQAVAGLGRR